jgi:cell division protein FtsW
MKKRPDLILILLTGLLVLTGIIMVFSSSPALALKLGDPFYYLKRHLFYVVLGLFGFHFAFNLNLHNLKRWSLSILGLAIVLLLLVYIPGMGKTLGGATRWLDLYVFSFQPSELAKFAMVVFLAAVLANKKDDIKKFYSGIFPLLLLLGIVMAIIIKQPDLGTAISIFGTALIMFFIAGAQLWHLLIILSLSAIGILVLSLTSPYRVKRLMGFINPWSDPLNVGFHIIQSLLAVGSGGMLGLGLGNSRQKFFYLPQQYADFIFAVLCEELGFIGATVLILIFLGFLARGLRIARRAGDDFSCLLASGLVAMFAVQTFLNLMVVLGLVPTTGIPLPFVSYGGTAMIVNLFSVGLLANISRQSR